MRPDITFAVLASSFGLLFLLFTPPGQAPDDAEHFFRAYQLSTGTWVATRDNDLVGGRLPEDLAVIAKMVPRGIDGRQQYPADVLRMIHTERSASQAAETMFIRFPNMALNFPILYGPQALGIAVGKGFSASPVALSYLARLANLLVWTVVIFFAVRAMPMAKWLMLMVALTPMSLYLATSASADALTYGLCLLFIAVVMNLAFGGADLTRRSMLLLVALCALVALSKIVYVVLILLLLLIPQSKFSSTASRWAFITLCFGVAAALALLWSSVVLHLHSSTNPGQTADPVAQIEYMLSDPLHYLLVFTHAVYNEFNKLARQLIGVLGWLDTPLPAWFYPASYLAIGLVSLFDQNPDVRLGLNSKLVLLLVLSAGTALIFAVLYIRWTPVGGTVIWGVQGRYFIPLSVLFWLLPYRLNLFDHHISQQVLGMAVTVFCAAGLSYVSWLLLHRYYLI